MYQFARNSGNWITHCLYPSPRNIAKKTSKKKKHSNASSTVSPKPIHKLTCNLIHHHQFPPNPIIAKHVDKCYTKLRIITTFSRDLESRYIILQVSTRIQVKILPCLQQVREDGGGSQEVQCLLPLQQTQKYPCSMSLLLKVRSQNKKKKEDKHLARIVTQKNTIRKQQSNIRGCNHIFVPA